MTTAHNRRHQPQHHPERQHHQLPERHLPNTNPRPQRPPPEPDNHRNTTTTPQPRTTTHNLKHQNQKPKIDKCTDPIGGPECCG